MQIGTFNLQTDVLVIAEIGNNHEGSYALAEELVGLAAEAGAGAVKFQTFKTELFTSQADPARFKRLKSFELSYTQFEKLSEIATKAGLVFISTPLDLESADFLNSIVSAFKIASGDNNFYPLLEKVAQTAKPLILSSGLSDMAQLRQSKSFIDQTWAKHSIRGDLAVLHCVSSYPVPADQANISALSQIRDELKVPVGYSDHTLGIDASILAVALGARIIEKHFTINKNHSDFRDHQLSADPAEMKLLVQKIKETQKLLGTGIKGLQECEKPVLGVARRSIVAKNDLQAGAELSWESLLWLRPANGLAPGNEKLVIGKKLTKSIKAGEPIRLEDLT
jgi:N,N'-diacetyllegionaminate synthase